MTPIALSLATLLAAAPDAGLAAAAPAPAAAAPSAEEIKRVLDYHESGKDLGPVLLDLVACLKVDFTKNSPTIYTCLEPVKGPVKKGAVITAWTSWFCPKGGSYDDLFVQFVHEGVVRSTLDLKVEGGWKTRNTRSSSLGKPGSWQVKVLRGTRELASVAVEVAPDPEPAKPAAKP